MFSFSPAQVWLNARMPSFSISAVDQWQKVTQTLIMLWKKSGDVFFTLLLFCLRLNCLLLRWKKGTKDGDCSPGHRKAVSREHECTHCVWPPASSPPERAWHKVQAWGSAPGNVEFALTVLWPWVSSYNVIPFHFPICKKVWKILTPYGGLNV